MSSRRFVYFFLGSLTFLRLLLIGTTELAPDEAYYTMWSQYPDLSYYSKGPGIAATIWLGTHFFGTNEFGVRFFSPLLALGTSLLLYSLARRLYGESVALWTTVMMNVLPIFAAGSVLMTIDPLSIFFWTAALATFWRALEEAPAFNRWWPLTGALIGLGFLCKWTNAMQLLSIVLLLAITRRHRAELRRAGFWVMLAVFALFTIPPIIWNYQHDWITLQHLSARGGLHKASSVFEVGAFFTFLGEHFLVYSPLIFLGMIVALGRGWGLMRNHFKPRFLLIFSLPILALYVVLAFRGTYEANWTAPAMPTLGILAVVIWLELAERQRWARIFAISGLAISAAIALVFLDTDLLRAAGAPLPYAGDPTSRLRGWQSSAEMVGNFRRQFEAKLGHGVFLIGDKYQTAAELGIYLKEKRPEAPEHPPVYLPESQAMENQFSFWPRYDEIEDLVEFARTAVPGAPPELRAELTAAIEAVPKEDKGNGRMADARRRVVQVLEKLFPQLPLDESFVEEQGVSLFSGRDALYVTDRAEEGAPSAIKGGFDKVEMIACIDLRRRNLPLRQWRIFACYKYHGISL